MLLCDGSRIVLKRVASAGALAWLALALSACQIQPLHSGASQGLGSESALTQQSSQFAVFVQEADDRLTQRVRNSLIFLLHGGAQQPANPQYELRIIIDDELRDLLTDPVAGRATGQSVRVSGVYQLLDPQTDEVLFASRVQAFATFDRFDQTFADERARLDAEDRAADILAERIRADLAIALQNGIARGPDQGT